MGSVGRAGHDAPATIPVRHISPSRAPYDLVNQAISTFKETTLASIISLPELTFQSLEIMAVTRMTFELWLTTATLYLLISYTWSGLGRRLEQSRRWRPLE